MYVSLTIKKQQQPNNKQVFKDPIFSVDPQDVIGGAESFSFGGKEKQQVETDEASLFTVSLKQLLLHQQVASAAFGCFLLQTGVNLGKTQRRRRKGKKGNGQQLNSCAGLAECHVGLRREVQVLTIVQGIHRAVLWGH